MIAKAFLSQFGRVFDLEILIDVRESGFSPQVGVLARKFPAIGAGMCE